MAPRGTPPRDAPSGDLAEAKAGLRERMREQLRALAAGAGARAGKAALGHLEDRPIWRDAGVVALYHALRDEVDTRPIADAAWAAGKTVLLPKVVGDSLSFHVWRPGDPLVSGAFGIREPDAETSRVEISAADLVLVPGLAFDRRGGRLGRGAGYYDRALAGLEARATSPMTSRSTSTSTLPSTPLSRVGIGFAIQLVEAVPMTSLDVPLDGIVTDDGWIDVERGQKEGSAAT